MSTHVVVTSGAVTVSSLVPWSWVVCGGFGFVTLLRELGIVGVIYVTKPMGGRCGYSIRMYSLVRA